MFSIYADSSSIDINKYIIATYSVTSNSTLHDAAWNIAVGQSVGNPSVRNTWESNHLVETHSCVILDDQAALLGAQHGSFRIGFPVVNFDFNTDGIPQLLCHLMGGHTDIDLIAKCSLDNLVFPPSVLASALPPKFGSSWIRNRVGRHNKPLLGGIIKPKTGLSLSVLLEITKQLVDGGVDFIKEDEILGNPLFLRLDDRVEVINNYLTKTGSKVVFCHTLNCLPHRLEQQARRVVELGGNGIHINVWSGLGIYQSIRCLDLPLFILYQKSGARVITDSSNSYRIAWPVLCQLAALSGVDSLQTGMIGGYSNDNLNEVLQALQVLRAHNVLPALSCGMHPGLVDKIVSDIGPEFLANVGGAIHGHPNGSRAGTAAMRQAIDHVYGSEYDLAVAEWGRVE
jgi:ribulose-bisphosphate carboxylase large chain